MYNGSLEIKNENQVQWRKLREGCFDMESFYLLPIREKLEVGRTNFPWKAIWKLGPPLKVAFFVGGSYMGWSFGY